MTFTRVIGRWLLTGAGSSGVIVALMITLAPRLPSAGVIVFSHTLSDANPARLYLLDMGLHTVQGVLWLPDNAYDGELAPDYQRLVFVVGDYENAELYTADLRARTFRALTDNNVQDLAPTWSPDGTHIAFHSNRDGNSNVYVIADDGRNLRQLTAVRSFAGQPSWSPDGTSIVYRNDDAGRGQIAVMPATGATRGDETRFISNHTGWAEQPSWSPDGAWIAFMGHVRGVRQLFIVGADGTGQRQLTDDRWHSQYPSWQGQDTVLFQHVDGRIVPYQLHPHQPITTLIPVTIPRLPPALGRIAQVSDGSIENMYPHWR